MSSPNIPPCELFSHLNEFRLENKFYDVVINVEDRKFHCHRIILASVFEYFRNMFCKNFKEANKEEIELKGILADDFELLLTHIYGGSVNFNGENVYRLLTLAHYLSLQTLEDNCVKYLLDKGDEITLDNAIYIFIFASKIGKNVLLEKFAGRMANNFESVSKSEKFLQVAAINLLRVLRHPDLIENSLMILSFLEEWVQFQSVEDKNLLPELLDAVDVKEIPKEWLVRVLTVRNNPSLSSPSEMTNKNADNDDGQSCFITKENLFIQEKEDKDKIYSHRDETKLPFIMYTLDTHPQGTSTAFINLHKFGSHNEVWPTNVMDVNSTSNNDSLTIQAAASIHYCKSILMNNIHYFITMVNNAARRYNGEIIYSRSYNSYICSRLKETKRLPDFHYDFYKRDISTLPALTITACASNIYLYTGGKFIMLNCQTQEWTELDVCTDDLEKTSFPNLVSYNDNLYLIGGKYSPIKGPQSISYIQHHIERSGRLFQHFDPRTGQISQMPRLEHARSKSASCIYNDTLYVTGGEDLAHFEGYIECFDFKAGKWYDMKTSMPEPRFSHTLLAHDNQLWFFGGQKYKNLEIVEDLTWCSYDLKENTWSDISQIPLKHNGFRVTKILDVLKL